MAHPDFSRMSREQFDATYPLGSMSTNQLIELKRIVERQLSQANDTFNGFVYRVAQETPISKGFNEAMRQSLETLNTLQGHSHAILMLEFRRKCEEVSMENTVQRIRQLGL